MEGLNMRRSPISDRYTNKFSSLIRKSEENFSKYKNQDSKLISGSLSSLMSSENRKLSSQPRYFKRKAHKNIGAKTCYNNDQKDKNNKSKIPFKIKEAVDSEIIVCTPKSLNKKEIQFNSQQISSYIEKEDPIYIASTIQKTIRKKNQLNFFSQSSCWPISDISMRYSLDKPTKLWNSPTSLKVKKRNESIKSWKEALKFINNEDKYSRSSKQESKENSEANLSSLKLYRSHNENYSINRESELIQSKNINKLTYNFGNKETYSKKIVVKTPTELNINSKISKGCGFQEGKIYESLLTKSIIGSKSTWKQKISPMVDNRINLNDSNSITNLEQKYSEEKEILGKVDIIIQNLETQQFFLNNILKAIKARKPFLKLIKNWWEKFDNNLFFQINIFENEKVKKIIKKNQIILILLLAYLEAFRVVDNLTFKSKSSIKSIILNLLEEISERIKEIKKTIINNLAFKSTISINPKGMYLKILKKSNEMAQNMLKNLFKNHTSINKWVQGLKEIYYRIDSLSVLVAKK